MSIQEDKYKALRTKSINTLKKLAKKYNIDIPKEMKNINYWAKRISNKIEDIQYTNYDKGIKKKSSLQKTFEEYKKARNKYKNSWKKDDSGYQINYLGKDAVFQDKYVHPLVDVIKGDNLSKIKKQQRMNNDDLEKFLKSEITNLKANSRQEVYKEFDKQFNELIKRMDEVSKITKEKEKELKDYFNNMLSYPSKVLLLQHLEDDEANRMADSLLTKGYSALETIDLLLQIYNIRDGFSYVLD